MKILQIIAHPAEKSFTRALAEQFRLGAEEAGHDVFVLDLYTSQLGIEDLENLILKADHLNFAWPCMWEMPPARLVDLFQTVFVKGFAFDSVDGMMRPKLNLVTTCIISMGQDKSLNTTNLSEAMNYCGLDPTFFIFKNVGPRLSEDSAEYYMHRANAAGKAANTYNNGTINATELP